MGFLSYIFLLFLDSGAFIKFFVLVFFILLFIILIFVFYKYVIINKYLNEIFIFDKEFNDKNIDLKEFYNKLLVKKSNIIGLSFIFFCGFKEFIFLHRKGISDVVVVAKMVKHVMRISMLREVEFLYKGLYFLRILKNFVIYLSFFVITLNIFIFFQKLDVNMLQDISYSALLFNLIETMFIMLFGLILIIPLDIVYKLYFNYIKKLSNKYEIFINEFIILLYHKLYN